MPDTLPEATGPALSSTSDLPVIDPANALPEEQAEPVDSQPKPDQTDGTSGEPEGEADSGPNADEATAGEDRTRPQDRAAITRFKNRAAAAEQRNAQLEQMLRQALEGIEKLTPKPQEPVRPQRHEFNSPEDYDQALMQFAAEGATKQATEAAKQQQQREVQEQRLNVVKATYEERAEAFTDKHPDYHDLVDADDAGFTLPMTAAILENEDGPAIAYHLAQNPEQLQRIAKLTPTQQVYEIGRVAARLNQPPPRAPKPIPPIGGRSSTQPKEASEMSMDEYAAMRASEDPDYARYDKARARSN
jgi:hypothetical protein